MRTLPRILIVEDEPAIAELIAVNLRHNGFRPIWAMDSTSAQCELDAVLPDVILLDWMLPDVAGTVLARRLRADARMKDIPVIMLTARAQETDKVEGLEAGADDYVTKPVVTKELAARIRAALRRAQLHEGPAAPAPLTRLDRVADLEIRRDLGIVLKAGRELPLTRTEYRLLCEFADHAGQVLSRDQLLERVWGYEYLGDSRLVDAHVRRLRVKIEDQPDEPRIIVTARGLGYRLVAG